MKIADIRWYVVPTPFKDFTMVVVETDDGITGVGEATLDYRSGQVCAGIDAAAQYLKGRSAIGVERIWADLHDRIFWRGGPADLAALSAIDQALWDIAGKSAGLPVHQLLGGPYRTRVRAYLNQWWRDIAKGADLVDLARIAVSEGATALKWYPFRFLPQHEQNWAVRPVEVQRAVDEVAAVRAAVGPNIDLMVDLWRRLDRAAAAQFCTQVAPYNLLFIEEPVMAENLEVLSGLARQSPVRLATGERLAGRQEFRAVIERQAVGIVQPSVIRVGGITEMRKIAVLAEMYGIGVAPHNPVGPIATAASVQVCAAIPNAVMLETYANGVPAVRDEFMSVNLLLNGDGFDVGTRPGLGVEVDEKALKRLATASGSARP
jgi:galactonate dehydratase